jgi:hypothetical protein
VKRKIGSSSRVYSLSISAGSCHPKASRGIRCTAPEGAWQADRRWASRTRRHSSVKSEDGMSLQVYSPPEKRSSRHLEDAEQ